MLTTCLACHTRFPSNETLEHFPVARRVAFDPARGRLWAVCGSCSRWTLAPFAARWEALEELEKVTRDRARLLAETDNIGLLTVGDIEIVRVGRAGLREESWWRFGKEFAARRKRAKRTTRRGKIVDGALFLLLTGIPYWGFSNSDRWIGRARRKQFGTTLWAEPDSSCPRCGRRLEPLRFHDYDELTLHPHERAPYALAVPCHHCARDGADPRHIIAGVPADHLLRRTLAYTNFAGGSEDTVEEAVKMVEGYDATDHLLRRVAADRPGLGTLDQTGAFALEIALNEDVERRLLEMELADLEARWKIEEEIAAIADTL